MDESVNILVVEDDYGFRDTLQDVLLEEGFRVTVAQDGAEALKALEAIGRPALVLLDLQMPVMDGLSFLSELTAHPERADFEVVVMSAGMDLHRLPDGARGVRTLRKPFDRAELLAIVAEFGRRQATAQPSAAIARSPIAEPDPILTPVDAGGPA